MLPAVTAAHDALRRFALTLPGVTETGPGHFDVAGKGLTWTWKERVQPKQARVPRIDILAFCTVDVADRDALIETHPTTCFTEPHYANFPAVLVRLEPATEGLLAELILDAWLVKAPRRLAAGFDIEGWLARTTAGGS